MELFTPSKRYKAVIDENEKYIKITLYWLQNKVYGNDEVTYWSRLSKDVIIVDTLEKAKKIAFEELEEVSGEILERQPQTLDIQWIREYSKCSEADFVDTTKVKVHFNCYSDGSCCMNEIEAKTIIEFSGLYLVEEINNEDDWLMGEMGTDGFIICWGYYGTLTEAIEAL